MADRASLSITVKRKRTYCAGVSPQGVRLSVCLALLAALFVLAGRGAAAAEDIRAEIDSKTEEIKRLEAEAERYRATLGEVERAADSLANQVKAIDLALRAIETNINITSAKISRTNLEIRELGAGIKEKEQSIETNREELGRLLGALAESDSESPLEILMKNETISAFFTSVDALLGVQRNLHSSLAELRTRREELKDRKTNAERKRLELRSLAEDLADQKALQTEERRQRNVLLQETRNQERRYQELLSDVVRRRDALQQEITSLESGLRATFDRGILPAAGSGILGWPLPDPVFITQHFGLTSFARAGGYNGKGHNGIDLRAPAGTAVFSPERGRVRAVGDTDVACRRASYGRWILIDHTNNLATLVAHLSLVKVRPGDAVNRGDLIGYSGRTGYATGPHLHFSVFAAEAVSVGELKSRVCGRNMTLPLAPFGGYLNPLDYL